MNAEQVKAKMHEVAADAAKSALKYDGLSDFEWGMYGGRLIGIMACIQWDATNRFEDAMKLFNSLTSEITAMRKSNFKAAA